MLEYLMIALLVWGLILIVLVDKSRYWSRQAAKELKAIREAMAPPTTNKPATPPAQSDGWS